MNLATDGAGTFYSEAACTSSITTVTISAGTNSAGFYYKATARGDGTHELTASDVAANGLTSASQVQTINDKTNQTITFPAVGPFPFGAQPTFKVAATATSGLTVSFATQTPTKRTVAGTTVTIVEGRHPHHPGIAGRKCHIQSGANVDQDITINKADQTITFPAVGPFTFGDPPFTVAATASSGIAVSFASETPTKCTVAGSTVTIKGAGPAQSRRPRPGT